LAILLFAICSWCHAFEVFRFTALTTLIFLSTSFLFFGFVTLIVASFAYSALVTDRNAVILNFVFLTGFTTGLFVFFFYAAY